MRDKLYVGQVFTGSDWEIDANVSQKRTLSCRDAFLVGMLRFLRRKVTIPNEADRFLVSCSPSHKPLPHGAASISESDATNSDSGSRTRRASISKSSQAKKPGAIFANLSRPRIVVHYPDHSTPGTLNRLGRQVTNGLSAKSKGRDDDKTASRSQDTTKSKSLSSAGASGVLGPTLPSTADLVLAREREKEEGKAERRYKRKRDKAEDKERIGEMVGP
ncbi:hypothetical protein C8J56DRAFT_1049009 [Mycena floridula]|nr:hypothetical protein C8J56DRAFT_1049009 [Mycena floridula]